MHDPELHLRWLQHGALSHVFRTHCEACEIRPWMFPVGWPELMFRAYHLRAALLPYLYTAAWQTTRSGVLTMHPLYYEWPDEEEAYAVSKFVFDDDPARNTLNVATRALQYLFGESLMAAPVQTPATIGVPPPPVMTDLVPSPPILAVAHHTGESFTLYKGQWCGNGMCMHQNPIGGIQPCPSYQVCEARCKASSTTPCLSFDFQSGKCYLWACYALEPKQNHDKTTVCGNRSDAPAPPPGPPAPPAPPPPPSPPPGPPSPPPPPKKAVGVAVQDVWIPPGDWIHWHSGKHLHGPQLLINQSFELSDTGLYARLGAVIPLKDAAESAQLAPNTLVLTVVAGAAVKSNGTCQVYEDDGESTGYLPGAEAFSLLDVTHQTAGGRAIVHVKPQGNTYDGALTEREYRIEYRNDGAEPFEVRLNGVVLAKRSSSGPGWSMRVPCKDVTCTYDGPAVVVRSAKLATSKKLTVEMFFISMSSMW
jgi:hypothetical protein